MVNFNLPIIRDVMANHPITNGKLTDKLNFAKVSRHLVYGYFNFDEVMYINYEGALRECRVLNVSYFRKEYKSGNVDDYATPHYDIEIAGVGRRLFESLPEMFYSENAYKAYIGEGREEGKVGGSVCEFRMEQLISMLNCINQNWLGCCCGNVMKYAYDAERLCPITKNVEIKGLWLDKNGWHIVSDDLFSESLYSTKEECMEANKLKVVRFGDKEKKEEKTTAFCVPVKIIAKTYEEAKEKVSEKQLDIW